LPVMAALPYSPSMKSETATVPPAVEIIPPDVSHLVTEDDTPVDNPFCEKQMRLLTRPLYASWNPGGPFVAMANVGLYFSLNSPPLVPDALVSMGVQLPEHPLRKEHRAYFHWLYGKAPDVVVEIVSNREGGELDRKFRGYAFHGVPYYVVFDPEGHIQTEPLRSFQLDHSEREPRYLPLAKHFYPAAQLGLVPWEGEFEGMKDNWIRWVNAAGEIIPTGQERAEAEQKRAEAESKRADAEKKRADVEAKRADALAARLRELGIDPGPINAPGR